jgi:hypothetical protein
MLLQHCIPYVQQCTCNANMMLKKNEYNINTKYRQHEYNIESIQ